MRSENGVGEERREGRGREGRGEGGGEPERGDLARCTMESSSSSAMMDAMELEDEAKLQVVRGMVVVRACVRACDACASPPRRLPVCARVPVHRLAARGAVGARLCDARTRAAPSAEPCARLRVGSPACVHDLPAVSARTRVCIRRVRMHPCIPAYRRRCMKSCVCLYLAASVDMYASNARCYKDMPVSLYSGVCRYVCMDTKPFCVCVARAPCIHPLL